MNLSKLNDVVCKDIILVNVVCKIIDVVCKDIILVEIVCNVNDVVYMLFTK